MLVEPQRVEPECDLFAWSKYKIIFYFLQVVKKEPKDTHNTLCTANLS